MADRNDSSKSLRRRILLKIIKASVKAAIFCVGYLLVSQFLAPISQLFPGFQQMIEAFVMVYVILMIIGDLTSGTIYAHFFNAAKALFVIGYLLLSLRGGVFGATFEGLSLTVDLRLLLSIATLLGLLGLAKSVLQAINYMSEKTEPPQI